MEVIHSPEQLTPDLKKDKNRKFNTKDEDGTNLEIEIRIIKESILFKTEINDKVITKKYSNIYSFSELKKNNIFYIQENIEEIYDQINLYINEGPVSSKVNENKVIIKLPTKIKKYPEIIFELKQDDKQIINILIDKISNLELKNNILESENKILKKEIEDLRINLNSINEYINEQKEKERRKKLKFNDSLIVKEEEVEMINDWINPDVNIKTKLLYRVSRDGDGADIFHKYCDNKGPTIIFAKISNGYRFGGFSGISWKSEGGCKKDKDAFLFSLNNKLKIMNNNSDYTVYHGKSYGPDFNNGSINELVINYCDKKCLTGKSNYCNDSGIAFTFRNKDLIGVDAKGQYNFDVIDYEVYSIII